VKESTLRVYPEGDALAENAFAAELALDVDFSRVGEAFGAYGEKLTDPAKRLERVDQLAALNQSPVPSVQTVSAKAGVTVPNSVTNNANWLMLILRKFIENPLSLRSNCPSNRPHGALTSPNHGARA
jgi:hypothetical protein